MFFLFLRLILDFFGANHLKKATRSREKTKKKISNFVNITSTWLKNTSQDAPTLADIETVICCEKDSFDAKI